MTHTPPSSSLIARVDYDPDNEILSLYMHSGKQYHYGDVPESTFIDLTIAKSVGSFYNQEIRGKYQQLNRETND